MTSSIIFTADISFNLLKNTLETLGFDVSMKKLVQPSTKVTCLGVEVDTINFTVAVPQDKLGKFSQTCQEWQHRKLCSKKELQSLLGSLLYISKCVKIREYSSVECWIPFTDTIIQIKLS